MIIIKIYNKKLKKENWVRSLWHDSSAPEIRFYLYNDPPEILQREIKTVNLGSMVLKGECCSFFEETEHIYLVAEASICLNNKIPGKRGQRSINR